MTYPDNASLEAIWDGSLGDTLEKFTYTAGAADAYGETSKTWATGGTTKGRLKIVSANEVSKEFGYLVPGDAIALVKNSFSIAQDDRIKFNGITYSVAGIVQKKTHQEIALKRVP